MFGLSLTMLIGTTLLGAFSLLVCIVSLVALHFLPTGYKPVSDPVSNYALGRYGGWYRNQAFCSGVAAVCLLIIANELALVLPLWGIVALSAYALSRIAIVAFPSDLQPPRTVTGAIHILLAACTLTGIAVAATTLSYPLMQAPLNLHYAPALHVAALTTAFSAIVFFVFYTVRPLRRFAGLVERVLYLGTLSWLGIVYIALIF